MSLESKRDYLRQIRSHYHRAGRVYKSKILDEYCAVCGYNRQYAIKRLAADPHRPRRKPGRQPLYDKENPQLVEVINDLYRQEWSAYQNFFEPSMKLVSKERVRSRYCKRYDAPQTPYERLWQSQDVSAKSKRRLR